MSIFDRFPWLGWVLLVVIEAAAIALGVLLWHFGYIAWYVIPLFLLLPPVAGLIAGFVGLASAESRGENPFE